MDANSALYQLKKIERVLSSGETCGVKSKQMLVDVCRYLRSMKLKGASDRLYEVILAIRSNRYFNKSLANKINGVMLELKKIKEKQLTMRCREAAARNHFFSKKSTKQKMNNNVVSKYDLIFAPTQGGYHYCVVAEIDAQNYVKCYPITTASEETLRKVNAGYVKIGCEGDRNLYLTSSCSILPYYTAVNCFVEKPMNKKMYKEAINSLKECTNLMISA